MNAHNFPAVIPSRILTAIPAVFVTIVCSFGLASLSTSASAEQSIYCTLFGDSGYCKQQTGGEKQGAELTPFQNGSIDYSKPKYRIRNNELVPYKLGSRDYDAPTYRLRDDELIPYQYGRIDYSKPKYRIGNNELVPYRLGSRDYDAPTYKIRGGDLIPYKYGGRDYDNPTYRLRD